MSDQLFDYSLLLSNSSSPDNGTCGGEKLESDVEVALGVVLAAAAFVAYIPQVNALFQRHHKFASSETCARSPRSFGREPQRALVFGASSWPIQLALPVCCPACSSSGTFCIVAFTSYVLRLHHLSWVTSELIYIVQSFEICAESLLVVISLFVPVIGQSLMYGSIMR